MELRVISQPKLSPWAIVKDEFGHFFVARANSLIPVSKEYRFIDPYPVDGFSRVSNSEGAWGMIYVPNGKEVIPCNYDVLSAPYPGGHVLAVEMGKDPLDEAVWLHLPQIA